MQGHNSKPIPQAAVGKKVLTIFLPTWKKEINTNCQIAKAALICFVKNVRYTFVLIKTKIVFSNFTKTKETFFKLIYTVIKLCCAQLCLFIFSRQCITQSVYATFKFNSFC